MTLRCVLVDDSPTVLRAASELLESEGIAVVGVAATGQEAVRLMEQLNPDVMLVDIDLGCANGFELVRRLVDTRDGAGLRTILMSTHDEMDYATLIATSPAIGFVPKANLSATAIHRLLARPHEEGSD